MKLRILGSGTSSGVPRIGNDWGACDPAEPRNQRTRASALIEHADHVVGIDDLRQIFHVRHRPVPAYARPATEDALRAKFDYVFSGQHGYPPSVSLASLPDRMAIGAIEIAVADQPHASITSAGLRFTVDGKSVGYATDLSEMTPEMRALYTGVDVWVVDALRRKPHPSHPHLGQVLEWVDELAPQRTVLIHMDQSMDYHTLRAELPLGVEPGYDGMEIAL